MKSNKLLIVFALCAAMQSNISFCMENPQQEPQSQSYWQQYAPQRMQDLSSYVSKKYTDTIGKWSTQKKVSVLIATLTVLGFGTYAIKQIVSDAPALKPTNDSNVFVGEEPSSTLEQGKQEEPRDASQKKWWQRTGWEQIGINLDADIEKAKVELAKVIARDKAKEITTGSEQLSVGEQQKSFPRILRDTLMGLLPEKEIGEADARLKLEQAILRRKQFERDRKRDKEQLSVQKKRAQESNVEWSNWFKSWKLSPTSQKSAPMEQTKQ